MIDRLSRARESMRVGVYGPWSSGFPCFGSIVDVRHTSVLGRLDYLGALALEVSWHHIRDQQHRQDTLRRIRGCWRRLTDLYGNEPIWIDVWTRLRPRLLYRRLFRWHTYLAYALSRGAPRSLLRREEVVPKYRTSCAITRCPLA